MTSLYNPMLNSDNIIFTIVGQAGSGPPPAKSGVCGFTFPCRFGDL